jgi:hypothetical protein
MGRSGTSDSRLSGIQISATGDGGISGRDLDQRFWVRCFRRSDLARYSEARTAAYGAMALCRYDIAASLFVEKRQGLTGFQMLVILHLFNAASAIQQIAATILATAASFLR